MSSAFEIEIAPSGANRILLDYTTFGMKKSMQFDGKDYSIVGVNAPEGYTGSAHEVNAYMIEITDKVKTRTSTLRGWKSRLTARR